MNTRFPSSYFCLLAGLIFLSGPASGIAIPTSEGNGADAFLTNDANRGPHVAHGEKEHMELRQFAETRARIVYIRFDLSEVSGDFSGARITLNGTTVNENRPIAFYGLEEDPVVGAGENWTESSISYSTASGVDSSAPLGSFALTSDATSSALASSLGSAVGAITTEPNVALDAFLAADTDGLVTFIAILEPTVTGSEYFFFTSKEGGGAPTLTLPNAVISAGDSDQDGLLDVWEDKYFGDGSAPATAGELALQASGDDPDGDGYSNLQEASSATDPNDGEAFPGADVYYVAPDGNDANPGTIELPFATVGRAQTEVAAGSTVYFRGGTYEVDLLEVDEYSSVFARVFLMNKSGTEESPIRYWAYRGEKPIFDLTGVNPTGYRVYTFYVTGDWLHFRGLTVTGVQVNITSHTQSICFDNEGSNNIYERLVMRDNQAIGIWIGNGSNNLVLNCDAYRNWDYTSQGGVGGNVDGFGCHASADEGNVFRGCRAWLNSDDGFDLINADHPVVIEKCWAAYNGYDYNFVSRGDGNGFKAGGYGSTPAANLPSPIPRHVVRDCLAIGNKQSGFYANHHPGGLTFVRNTALRNKRNFNMLNRLADNVTDVDGYDHILRNNLGFNATLSELTNVDLPGCDSSHNFWELPVVVDSADFESIDESFLTAPRQPSGELPVVPLMRLVKGSDLVDQGAEYGVPFAGDAPDLGCHETGLIELGAAGFELPIVSSPVVRTAGAVWDFSGLAGIQPDALASEGSQVAFLKAGGCMSQSCSGFVAGKNYHLHLQARAPAGSGELELRMDGVPFASAEVAGGGFVGIDRMFTASATDHVLDLVAADGSNEIRIDGLWVVELLAESDSDGDGLSDVWEFQSFASLAETARGDFDGDGSTQQVEEILGLDPTSSAEAFRCDLISVGVLEWPGATGVEFTVWRSTNLLSWDILAQVDGEAGMMSYTDPYPAVDGAFYRVSFLLP